MPGEVIDTSLLGAIVFGEPRAKEAISLIEGEDLYAPSLLAYELTSVARKKARLYPDQHEKLAQALGLALSLDIHWMEVDHVATFKLAMDTGLTTYDASYLYLARSLGLPLATFDERLRTAMHSQL